MDATTARHAARHTTRIGCPFSLFPVQLVDDALERVQFLSRLTELAFSRQPLVVGEVARGLARECPRVGGRLLWRRGRGRDAWRGHGPARGGLHATARSPGER